MLLSQGLCIPTSLQQYINPSFFPTTTNTSQCHADSTTTVQALLRLKVSTFPCFLRPKSLQPSASVLVRFCHNFPSAQCPSNNAPILFSFVLLLIRHDVFLSLQRLFKHSSVAKLYGAMLLQPQVPPTEFLCPMCLYHTTSLRPSVSNKQHSSFPRFLSSSVSLSQRPPYSATMHFLWLRPTSLRTNIHLFRRLFIPPSLAILVVASLHLSGLAFICVSIPVLLRPGALHNSFTPAQSHSDPPLSRHEFLSFHAVTFKDQTNRTKHCFRFCS